jgi:broad specificity phosphatase PhoE
VVLDSRFSERSFGPFEGRFLDDVRSEKARLGLPANDVALGWGTTAGVERQDIVGERMFAGLVAQFDETDDDECLVIVSHAAALHILCSRFWGLPESALAIFSLRPASYMRLWAEPEWSGAQLLELWMNPLAQPSWLPPAKGLVTAP